MILLVIQVLHDLVWEFPKLGPVLGVRIMRTVYIRSCRICTLNSLEACGSLCAWNGAYSSGSVLMRAGAA